MLLRRLSPISRVGKQIWGTDGPMQGTTAWENSWHFVFSSFYRVQRVFRQDKSPHHHRTALVYSKYAVKVLQKRVILILSVDGWATPKIAALIQILESLRQLLFLMGEDVQLTDCTSFLPLLTVVRSIL